MSHGGTGSNGALIASMCMGVAGYFAYNVSKKLWKGIQSSELKENDPIVDTDLPPHYPKRQRLVYQEDINDLAAILEELNITGLDVNQLIKKKVRNINKDKKPHPQNENGDNNDDEDDADAERDEEKPETIQEGDEDAEDEGDEASKIKASRAKSRRETKQATKDKSKERGQQGEHHEDDDGEDDEEYEEGQDEEEGSMMGDEVELSSQALELTPFAKFSLAKLTSHTPSINSELRAEWESSTWRSLAEGHILRERRRLRKKKQGSKRVPKHTSRVGIRSANARQSDNSQDQDEVMSSVSNPRENRRPASSNGDNASEKKASSVTSSSRNNTSSQQDKSEGRRERERESNTNGSNSSNSNSKPVKGSGSRRRRTKRKRGIDFRNQSALSTTTKAQAHSSSGTDKTATSNDKKTSSKHSNNFVPLACQQSLRSRTVWKKVQAEDNAKTASKTA